MPVMQAEGFTWAAHPSSSGSGDLLSSASSPCSNQPCDCSCLLVGADKVEGAEIRRTWREKRIIAECSGEGASGVAECTVRVVERAGIKRASLRAASF